MAGVLAGFYEAEVAAAARMVDYRERVRRCFLGICVGDALAFPYHWYYDYAALQAHLEEHYPNRLEYYSVPEGLKHPSSWKYFSLESTKDADRNPIDIFNDQHEAWATEGTHYHHQLPAGDNTGTTALARRLAALLVKKGCYTSEAYLKEYTKFWSNPGEHQDTFVETVHRLFFRKWASGVNWTECGTEGESCLSGLTLALPLIIHGLSCGESPIKVLTTAIGHVSLVTRAVLLNKRLSVVVWLMHRLLRDPEHAQRYLREAFDHLTSDQELDLDELVLQDDTDLFWGAGRGALGRDEQGNLRGDPSTFSIS